MSQPLPRVSARHYAKQPAAPAKIRWRLKGNPDGPVYQGTRIVSKCATCGKGARSSTDH